MVINVIWVQKLINVICGKKKSKVTNLFKMEKR